MNLKKTSRVLLIDTFGWQGGATGNRCYPNVGIAYLTSALTNKGFDVSIMDLNNAVLSDGAIISSISQYKPDIIGFSVKTATLKSARKIGALIKSMDYDIPIVVGGAHASVSGSSLAREPWVDVVLSGEGEEVFPLLCTRLVNRESIKNMPGVITSRNDDDAQSIIPHVEALDSLQFPDYSRFSKCVKEALKTGYPLVTSRGCAFGCVYCSVPTISGKRFRKRSPDNVINELIMAMNSYAINEFEIIDDAFNLDMNRAKEICRAFIGLGLTWSCPNGLRADRVDAELADLMYESGCRSVMVGIESADPRILSMVRKGETIEDIEKGIQIFQHAGIKVGGFFIIGLPGDSYKSQERSIKFVQRTHIGAQFNMIVPYPGTEFWKWSRSHARFLHDIEDGLHFADSCDRVSPVLETDDFPAHERLRAYEMVHTKTRSFGRLIPPQTNKWQFYLRALKLIWKYDRYKLVHHMLWWSWQRAQNGFRFIRKAFFKTK